jgi:hypothetical protein
MSLFEHFCPDNLLKQPVFQGAEKMNWFKSYPRYHLWMRQNLENFNVFGVFCFYGRVAPMA